MSSCQGSPPHSDHGKNSAGRWVKCPGHSRSGSRRRHPAMSRTSDTHTSGSDYWSASGHSTVRSWSGAFVEPTERQELDLLASETLSQSDDDCASTATPTFSDKSEAPQAVAARNSGQWGCVAQSLVPITSASCTCTQEHCQRSARLRMLQSS